MHCGLDLAKRLFDRSRALAREMAVAAASAGVPGPNLLEPGDSYAIFAGRGSPVTQGGGRFHEAELAAIRDFYRSHGCGWEAVVTPFTPVDSLNRLLSAGATVMNWENVLVRQTNELPEVSLPDASLIEVGETEVPAWSEVALKGFFGKEADEMMRLLGRVMEAMICTRRYLVICEGQPAAAATLSICEGVAAMGGAATLPKFRGRGFQSALIARRLADASREADLATIGSLPGSTSQRNAERLGFRVAFTSLSLAVPGPAF